MPSKRHFPRLRAVRFAVRFAVLLIGLTSMSAFSSASDSSHPVWAVLAGCAGFVVGICVLAWGGEACEKAGRRDRARLRAAGLDDGLPLGVFREGNRLGLEANDWPLVIAALLGLSGCAVLSALIGPEANPDVDVPFALAFLVPAAAFTRLGTGTHYRIGPESIEKSRWLRHSLRWTDVARVERKGRRGQLLDTYDRARTIELYNSSSAGFSWRPLDFTVHCYILEASAPVVGALIDQCLQQAQEPAPTGSADPG